VRLRPQVILRNTGRLSVPVEKARVIGEFRSCEWRIVTYDRSVCSVEGEWHEKLEG